MSTFISGHDFVNAPAALQPTPAPTIHHDTRPDGLLHLPTPATSALVSGPPRNAKSPPISGSTESTKSPVEVLPVASLTQPIRYGPPKPARVPIELIRAIAPAAAVPESQAVGSVQNTPKVQKIPIAATTSATMVT